MNIFPETPNFDILGQRRAWIIASIVLTLLTFAWPLVRSPNWGVDFAGGTELQVQFKGDVDASAVREAVESVGISEPSVQQFGDAAAHEFLIRIGRATLFTDDAFRAEVEPKLRAALPVLQPGAEGIGYDQNEGDQVTLRAPSGLSEPMVQKAFEDAGLRVQTVKALTEGSAYSVLLRGISDKVSQALDARFPGLRPEDREVAKADGTTEIEKGGFVRRVEQVGASVGTELKRAAIKALLLSILLILLYIGFRFDFAFATGAVVSLFHDAVIVVGFYLVSGAELNTTTIAAVLTIIGYSVNDTVIIFDRVRENLQKHKGRELYKVINDSINETLSRTIITHLTVLLSLAGLVIFTVGTLREFALAMAVGVITGTYSSVFIAAPVVLWIEAIAKARREAAASASGRPGTPAKV